MFPLDFPYSYLKRSGSRGEWVLDPFCGRGTTNYAARLCGMPSIGMDSSPVAAAIAQAKFVQTTPSKVLATLDEILSKNKRPDVPEGEFWEWAFDQETLRDICAVRSDLLGECTGDERLALRAIILGALHGPKNKERKTYLSNQCPRTFAPKPSYALKVWKRKKLKPEPVSLYDVVAIRASWYLKEIPPKTEGNIFWGDCRKISKCLPQNNFSFVITSPPYYGMRTYIPDQWLRNWFLGGEEKVCYSQPEGELRHHNPESFVAELADSWKSIAPLCRSGAKMVCRFGGINDRRQDPVHLLYESLRKSGWKVLTRRDAGDSLDGRRQAEQFGHRISKPPRSEFDVYAVRV
jgi:hypothetical protein